MHTTVTGQNYGVFGALMTSYFGSGPPTEELHMQKNFERSSKLPRNTQITCRVGLEFYL